MLNIVKIKSQKRFLTGLKSLLKEKGEYFFSDMDNIQTVDELCKYLQDKQIFFAYESSDKELVGMYAIRVKKQTREISGRGVIIKSGYRGKGYAQELITNVLRLFPNYTLKFVIHPSNTASLILFLKLGAKVIGFIDNFKNTGQPRLVLSKEL